MESDLQPTVPSTTVEYSMTVEALGARTIIVPRDYEPIDEIDCDDAAELCETGAYICDDSADFCD